MHSDYEKLNLIREYVIALPSDSYLRRKYRDFRRCLHNVSEDVEATGVTEADVSTISSNITKFVILVKDLAGTSTLLEDIAKIPGKGKEAKARRHEIRQAEADRIATILAGR